LYFADYLRSAMPGMKRAGKYRLLEMETPEKSLFALDDWIVPIPPPKESLREDASRDAIPFAISSLGAQHGGIGLGWKNLATSDSRVVHSFLRHWVYDGRTLTDILLRPSLCAALACLFFIPLGISRDLRRRREIRRGRRIRGPELVTRARFNRIMRSAGVGFQTTEPLELSERFLDRTKRVRLREVDEFSHFLIIGDSGSGKSSLIRQMLLQIQHRQQPAIVYDPDCQFIRHFYNEKRGDWVLNPMDARCPYWHPGDEINYAADAVAVASSLYSRDLREPPFFMDSARDLMAELLKWDPSAADLAHWMAHPEEIDRRIVGTPLESVITHNAQGQRMGVLGTFNKISAAMNLLPAEPGRLRRWSANAWASDRKGWIFVTSTPEAREALRPLHSLWLDTLILRLLGTGQESEQGVWIVLDELASLQRLPQLHTAITEGRKSRNRIAIGIQGSAQLETLYGQMAVTMLSQPATKILLRTSEPRAAKWMQDTIGEIEVERFRESRQANFVLGAGKRSKTYSQERKAEPLISAAQISGLPNMKGYLKSGNYVVEIGFPYLELPVVSPGLIRRDVNKIQFRKMEELPSAEKKQDGPGTSAYPADEAIATLQSREAKPQNGYGAAAPSPGISSPKQSSTPPARDAGKPAAPGALRPAASGFLSRMATVDATRQARTPEEQTQRELAFHEQKPEESLFPSSQITEDKQRLGSEQTEAQQEEREREQTRLDQQMEWERALSQTAHPHQDRIVW